MCLTTTQHNIAFIFTPEILNWHPGKLVIKYMLSHLHVRHKLKNVTGCQSDFPVVVFLHQRSKLSDRSVVFAFSIFSPFFFRANEY